jgi:hypothetical protein
MEVAGYDHDVKMYGKRVADEEHGLSPSTEGRQHNQARC